MRMTVEQYEAYIAKQGEKATEPKRSHFTTRRLPVSEHDEQCAIVERCKIEQHRYPELRMLVAIPNAGERTRYTGNRMKQEGMAVGFPDLMLLTKSKIKDRWEFAQFGGLFIELKTAIGKVSDEQREWVKALNEQGYYACICRGQDECWKTILWYLGYRDVI